MIFYDFEVFLYDWLVVILDMDAKEEHVIVNDPDRLKQFYETHKGDIWCGYNSRDYDQFILKAILLDFDPKKVNMSDGKFELFLIKPPADVIQITQCLDAINTKKYHKSDIITFASAKEICVESDGSFPWTLDGEKHEGMKKIKVSNLHHAINIIKKK